MNRPRHPKPDANEAETIALLLSWGYHVVKTSPLGGNGLDFFVGGYHHELGMYLWSQWELKTAEGRLTEDEREYIETVGYFLPVRMARSAEEIDRWYKTSYIAPHGSGANLMPPGSPGTA